MSSEEALDESLGPLFLHCWRLALQAICPSRLVLEWWREHPGFARAAAVGKAAELMSKPLWSQLQQILLISHQPVPDRPRHVESVLSSHPHLSQASLLAGERLLEFVRASDEPLLLLISGGSSALVEVLLPEIDPERHFADWRQAYRRNWSIGELNAWRSRYSLIKGGKLGEQIAGPAHALIWCDVLAGPAWVGSGLAQGVSQTVLADGHRFRDQLAAQIRGCGWVVRVCEDLVGGLAEAEASIRSWLPRPGEVCLASAEVTLTVSGSGRGGRCQHLALRLLPWLERSGHRGLLAASSDGTDGPTPAAGAWIDKGTARLARALGAGVDDFLARQDSYGFFEKLGLSWQTGSTGNNLNDVVVLVG